jgi:hypothetical protein
MVEYCEDAYHFDRPLQVAEPARFLLGHGHGDRMLAEVGYRVAEVIQE